MSQNNKSEPAKIDLSPELITKFLDTQHHEAEIKLKELALREKELELNAQFAKESMGHQAAYISKQPLETRKTITTMFWIAAALILLVFGFITLWLYMGKPDIAYKLLQGISYVFTTGMGYYFGNKNKGDARQPSEDIQDTRVVD